VAAYYNEIDHYAAQWLRNLIDAGHIARGDVDERSIVDVRPHDLAGYDQCHFFAGIGGWSYALRLAGWPDDRPVWTGSCPCQPFSAAGAGKAADDERHLWPAWFPLIRERRPAIVFGEQVEAAIGWGWLDAVFADLEGEGYACGAAVLPACGVGAPHIRQRAWFMAHTDGRDASAEGLQRSGQHGQRAEGGRVDTLADSTIAGWPARPQRSAGTDGRAAPEPGRLRDAGELGNPNIAGLALRSRERRDDEQELATAQRAGGAIRELGDPAINGIGARDRQPGSSGGPQEPAGGSSVPGQLADSAGRGFGEQRDATWPRRGRHADGGGVLNGFWSDAEWIACTDGKARPVGPGSFPLGYGIPKRPSKLRAYGNAIVPQVAAEFIAACSDQP